MRKRSAITIIILLFIMYAVIRSCCRQHDRLVNSWIGRTAVITTVVVHDAESGHPVEGATVFFEREANTGIQFADNGDRKVTLLTGPDGKASHRWDSCEVCGTTVLRWNLYYSYAIRKSQVTPPVIRIGVFAPQYSSSDWIVLDPERFQKMVQQSNIGWTYIIDIQITKNKE